MSPAAKKIRELLYVSDLCTNDVFVYNYKTGALVGTLTGFNYPRGECVDKNGDVWITNYGGDSVVEYAHGASTQKKSLLAGGYEIGCSIDPTTGDLAVSIFNAYVTVWKHASGSAKNYYSSDCAWFLEPGYDNKGNLYVESGNRYQQIAVCELPHGRAHMKKVPSNAPIDYEAGTMWDGKYITLADQDLKGEYTSGIYQMTESASGGLTMAGSTDLTDPVCGNVDVEQPFIVGKKNTPLNDEQGDAVVGNNFFCHNRQDFWSYPEGGAPTRALVSAPNDPCGQAVSIAN